MLTVNVILGASQNIVSTYTFTVISIIATAINTLFFVEELQRPATDASTVDRVLFEGGDAAATVDGVCGLQLPGQIPLPSDHHR